MKKTQPRNRKKTTEAERIKHAYDKAVSAKGCPLDSRERDIIERYYAFNGHSRHTLKEIADELGITRERVRQIKHHAIKKIIPDE